MRELERLQASIPGAPPLTGDTQGFSVKAAPLAYPVAMGLVYLGTNYPRVHNFVQGALRATLSSLATKTSELDQARAKKAAKDAEFAEAVKNGDSASFQRLRAESNELKNEILRLEAEQRQLEQAKHNHEQNLQKLDQLGQNVAGVQASAQDNCNTPNPSPSPTPSPSHNPNEGPYDKPDKVTDHEIEKHGLDPHEIKRDLYGKKAKISLYDLYVDSLGYLYGALKGKDINKVYSFTGIKLF